MLVIWKMNSITMHFEGSPRRNKYEIWIELLSFCSHESRTLSKIMRELRLRSAKCKEYLIFLIQRKLISVFRDDIDGNIKYKTSEKGKSFHHTSKFRKEEKQFENSEQLDKDLKSFLAKKRIKSFFFG